MRGILFLALVVGLAVVALFSARDGATPVVAAINLNVHVHDNFYHPAGTFGSPTDHSVAQAACQKPSPDAACDAIIHVGDTITWVAPPPMASAPHSVTECSDGTFTLCANGMAPSGPINDSGVLAPASWPYGPVTFNNPGTYFYACSVHQSSMRGRVVVLALGSPTPVPPPGDPVVGGIAGLQVGDGNSGGSDALLYALAATMLGLTAASTGAIAWRRRTR